MIRRSALLGIYKTTGQDAALASLGSHEPSSHARHPIQIACLFPALAPGGNQSREVRFLAAITQAAKMPVMARATLKTSVSKRGKREEMVGTTRFELATSPTPRVRSTRLSHVPTYHYLRRLV